VVSAVCAAGESAAFVSVMSGHLHLSFVHRCCVLRSVAAEGAGLNETNPRRHKSTGVGVLGVIGIRPKYRNVVVRTTANEL
jgi:hypothetical protein